MKVDLHNWDTVRQLTMQEALLGKLEWVSIDDHQEFTSLMSVQYVRSRRVSQSRRRGPLEVAGGPAEREFMRVQAEHLVRDHVRPCV